MSGATVRTRALLSQGTSPVACIPPARVQASRTKETEGQS